MIGGVRVTCITSVAELAIVQHQKEVVEQLASKRFHKRKKAEAYRQAMKEVEVSSDPFVYEFLLATPYLRQQLSFEEVAHKVREMMLSNGAQEFVDYELEVVL